MWYLLASVVLGWSLGANNAASIIGTAVTSQMLRFRSAVLLASVFVILGAVLEGQHGLITVGALANQTIVQATVILLAAGLAVGFMTKLKLPVSASQAVVGAILGAAYLGPGIEWKVLQKIVICWIATPIGAALLSVIFYCALSRVVERLQLNFIGFDRFIRVSLIVCAAYAAYALGANNVANVTGVFLQAGLLDIFQACLYGSLAIAFGMRTYSKNVITTIGHSIVPLNSFGALVVSLSTAVTVHVFAKIGVPVSFSQAVVGAVLGIGFIQGFNLVNAHTITHIILGWITAPAFAGGAAIVLTYLSRVRITIV